MRIWMPGVALSLSVAVLVSSVATAQDSFPNWPSERAPRPLPSREVKFPPYEIRTLANGMRVLAILHHEQPVVTMRMLVGAGDLMPIMAILARMPVIAANDLTTFSGDRSHPIHAIQISKIYDI